VCVVDYGWVNFARGAEILKQNTSTEQQQQAYVCAGRVIMESQTKSKSGWSWLEGDMYLYQRLDLRGIQAPSQGVRGLKMRHNRRRTLINGEVIRLSTD